MAHHRGGCLCGAIRYELKSDPVMTAVCHCTHCQRISGGVFSTNLVIPEADYAQTGETKEFQDKGDSGLPVLRHFCPTCGSSILSRVAAMPGVIIVKAGTLDDLTWVNPTLEAYTDHAAAFVPALAGALRFPQGAG